ncbi:MAG: hypothetical protein LBQ68_08830 [Clostridiales bacterium]|jgi:hypothetical protein|nr:hypothetical protein [Clostridiales bacterium]
MKFNFNSLKRKKTGIVFITIGVTALICVILFLIFGSKLLLNPNREFEPEQISDTSTPLQGPNNSITIPGFETLTIPAGKTSVSAYLYNPEENICYFEISILLTDTNTEIYKSKLVSPGQKLYQIELNQALKKGTYDAVVHYSTYALSDYADMNGANVPFTLIVE